MLFSLFNFISHYIFLDMASAGSLRTDDDVITTTIEEKQAGEVLCSMCAGAKLPALRSCLECGHVLL